MNRCADCPLCVNCREMRLAARLRRDMPAGSSFSAPQTSQPQSGSAPTCEWKAGKWRRKERVGEVKVETEGETGEERIACALLNSWLPPCITATFPRTLLALHAQQRLCNGRLSRRSTAAAAACGWFAAERAAKAADIDRQLARSVANAGSVMS